MSAKPKQEVKEKPILFSSPMIKAIMNGSKTQTRRVVNPQPERCLVDCDEKGWYYQVPIHEETALGMFTFMDRAGYTRCPYGSVGSRLWCRETWAMHRFSAGRSGGLLPERITYKADDEVHGIKWRPSIFLRRKDSRITLEITGIRVERLQSITRQDAIAEGMPLWGIEITTEDGTVYLNEYQCFSTGWNQINGKRKGCDWQSNPFVWVIEFKRV